MHRADGSGTTWIFTNYLSTSSPAWKSSVGTDKAVAWPAGVGGKGNEGVSVYVQRVDGAIGYVEYAYAIQNKLNTARMKNRAGSVVEPGARSFQAAAASADWSNAPAFYVVLTDQPGADAWPMVGASFILMRKEPKDLGKAREILRFFDFGYRKGAAAALDYVPMPDAVVQSVESMWAESIRWPSRVNPCTCDARLKCNTRFQVPVIWCMATAPAIPRARPGRLSATACCDCSAPPAPSPCSCSWPASPSPCCGVPPTLWRCLALPSSGAAPGTRSANSSVPCPGVDTAIVVGMAILFGVPLGLAAGLSGGQQQRLCIARALAVRPEVLLLDEPASALDPIATARIEELLRGMRGVYTVVLVTHNMQQAARVSDYAAFFHLGELVEHAPTDRLFTSPRERRTEEYTTGKFG